MSDLPVITQPIYSTTLPISEKTITYRPYLLKEEKIMLIAIASQNFNDIRDAIKQIVKNCTNNTVNPTELTYVDVLFILSKVRAAARGNAVPVTMNCQHIMENGQVCGTANEVALDLEQLQLTHDHNKEHDIMPLTDSINLKLAIPGIDMLEILHNDLPDVTKLACMLVESVYDNENVWSKHNYTSSEWESFIENSLNVVQLEEIQAYADNMPKTKIDVPFECSNCGHKEIVAVEDIQDFLD